MSGQLAGKYFRLVNVFTSDSKVRKTLQGYFLCMARTGDDGYILFGNTVYLVSDMKEVNPQKLHMDICGINKKYKLELTNPTVDEVAGWIAKIEN